LAVEFPESKTNRPFRPQWTRYHHIDAMDNLKTDS